MASARQIAANRRNAEKSTGPRSKTGRQRTSRNAHRHGLAARPILSAVAAKQIEKLVHKIAGPRPDVLTRDWARTAAEAMLDLARVRWAKMDLLERAAGAPSHEPRELLSADPDPQPALYTAAQQQATESGDQATSPAAAIPTKGFAQYSEAILQNLSELRALERYERRISSRRDRAIRQIVKRK